MIESIINPRRIERGPIKMFFVGIIFATLSLLLVHWFFSSDSVLSQYSGMIVVTFCVMFSFPYIYYLIKQEEKEDEQIAGFLGVWKVHRDAIFAFMWLFLGFIIAFAACNIILQNSNLFNAQVETYCAINSPGNVDACVENSLFDSSSVTGAATKELRLISIIENNVYVMIFTLIFSLIFGAGAIFILAWNASVIASAIGIFTKYELSSLPVGIIRYMIHGIPEISAYFVTALAGGIIGTAIIRKQMNKQKMIKIFENCIILLFIGLALLIIGALIEVYITPMLFS